MNSTQFLKKYNSVIFDNDGVIMDSNAAKTEAFAKALDGEGAELIDEFIKYHQTFGGISRFEKIKYFYSVIKNEKNYENSVKDTLQKYAYFSKKALLSADLLPGIEDFLKFLKNNNKSIFIISGGDQSELIEVFQNRNLLQYFTEVNGSPASKSDILKKLVIDNKISFPAAYFGDAKLDYSTSKEYGVDFIFIYSKSEWKEGINFCKKNNCRLMPNFLEFKN